MKHLTCLLYFLSFMAWSQKSIDSTKYFDSSNFGTLKKITNEQVCAIVVFASGPNSNWSKQEKKSRLAKDNRQFKALKKEIAKYGVDFDIHFEIFNLESDFEIESILDYASPKQFTVHQKWKSKRMNAEKIWNHYSQSEHPFFKNEEYKSYPGGYFLLIHQVGMGRSSASPDLSSSEERTDIPEYVTVFSLDRNGKKASKFTTAHETLHLFGAWDLYRDGGMYGFNTEDYMMLFKKYPKSIMRRSTEIQIDPLTAWRIGLNDTPEEWFFNMVPRAYHKSTYQK